MTSWLIIFLLHSVSIILMSASMMWLFVNARDLQLARSFILCQGLLIIWLIGQLMEVTANTLQEQTFALNFTWIAVCFLSPCFFRFSLKFTRRDARLPLIIRCLLFAPGSIFYFLFVTNLADGFFFSIYELGAHENTYGFYITVGVNYLYFAASLFLILSQSIKTYMKHRFQIWLIGLAVLVPFVFNVVSLYLLATDFTPYAFSVSALLIFVAIGKYDFMNVAPLALNKIVHSLQDPIIVTDVEGKITFFNDAAETFSPYERAQRHVWLLKDFVGIIKNCASSDQHAVIDNICEKEVLDDPNIRFKSPSGRIYTIKKQPFYGNNAICLGYIIHMNDITDLCNALEALKSNNEQLLDANIKLSTFNKVAKQLALEKQRTKLTQHLHDTMGHDLAIMVSLIRATLKPDNQLQGTISNNLNKILSLLYKLLQNVRKCVREFDKDHDRDNSEGVVTQLESLIRGMHDTHIALELSIVGKEKEIHSQVAGTIVDVVREALTNAIRHGQAEQVDIIVRFFEDKVEVYIMDNGKGCGNLHKNMGLKGMENAIWLRGGYIKFSSDIGEGFSVLASIPIINHL